MITRHQQGFTVVHPMPAFPSPVTPDGTGILGLYPELHTRLSRTQQRMSGRGRAWTLPGLRPWHQPASFDALTHHVRPHVAAGHHHARTPGDLTPRSSTWLWTTPTALLVDSAQRRGTARCVNCGALLAELDETGCVHRSVEQLEMILAELAHGRDHADRFPFPGRGHNRRLAYWRPGGPRVVVGADP